MFMTFLMLFSSVGFSMDVHFCGGKIENIGFFGKAEECIMMKEAKAEKEKHACCGSKEKVISHCSKNDLESEVIKGKCCHNENFVLQSVDDTNTSNALVLEEVDLIFVSIFILNSIYLFDNELEVNNYFNYKPPPIDYDVTILHQVFII